MNEILLTIYFGAKIISLYKIEIKTFLYWKKLLLIFSTGFVLIPILFLSDLLFKQSILTVVLISMIYLILYFILVRKFEIEEVEIFLKKLFGKIKFLNL
jgi:hypothetical protein